MIVLASYVLSILGCSVIDMLMIGMPKRLRQLLLSRHRKLIKNIIALPDTMKIANRNNMKYLLIL